MTSDGDWKPQTAESILKDFFDAREAWRGVGYLPPEEKVIVSKELGDFLESRGYNVKKFFTVLEEK